MLHAFFDDSKTFSNKGFLCLCGYLAEDSCWDRFCHDWEILLGRYHINRLHTADFLAAENREYQHLKDIDGAGSYNDRAKIISDSFIPIIQNSVAFWVAIGIEQTAFHAIFKNRKRRQSAEEFFFYRVIRRFIDRRSLLPSDGLITVIFDDSEEHSMKFYGAYRKLRAKKQEIRNSLTGICFGDDRFIQPLQAADLLACTTVREMRRGQYAWNEPSPFRGLLQASSPVYGIIYETEYWDEQSINENRNALLSL